MQCSNKMCCSGEERRPLTLSLTTCLMHWCTAFYSPFSIRIQVMGSWPHLHDNRCISVGYYWAVTLVLSFGFSMDYMLHIMNETIVSCRWITFLSLWVNWWTTSFSIKCENRLQNGRKLIKSHLHVSLPSRCCDQQNSVIYSEFADTMR